MNLETGAKLLSLLDELNMLRDELSNIEEDNLLSIAIITLETLKDFHVWEDD